MSNINRDKAKTIVVNILEQAHKRFKQELAGENEDILDRSVRQHQAKVARYSWKHSQKWCKWNDDGPVLMPDFTRIYYRKGKSEILVQEFPPQVRLMKFRGALAKRGSSDAMIDKTTEERVFNYSLALPYMVFIFKFVDGMFSQVNCAFSDRPLKRLEEKPLRPYLSNIGSDLKVCLGHGLDKSQLIKDNVTQQSSLILSHFWHSAYSDEWSQHYWNTKANFVNNNDKRMQTLDAWQAASIENPLFVIEDVSWLPYENDNFGDIIVKLLEHDKDDVSFHTDLYNELVSEFLNDVTKTLTDNIDKIEDKVVECIVDQLTDELVEKINARM